MQTEYILIYLIAPIFMEGCCVGKRRDFQLNTSELHYRIVEGDIFIVPCINMGKCMEGETASSFFCGETFIAEAKHSGNYTCDTDGSKIFLFLQVVEKISLGCPHPEESTRVLLNAAGGTIPCPGRNCTDNTVMRWYKLKHKEIRPVSKQHRASCEQNGLLHLCQVSELDVGVYFCDRQIIEHGVNWTFRRAVNVTVIPYETATYPPRIMDPDGNTTKEVELGKSYNLTCKVHFPLELHFSADVRWFMNYGGKMENMLLLPMEKPQQKTGIYEAEVIQTAVIKEVTPKDLTHTYTCIASNSVGEITATIKLKRKVKVKWPSLVGYPFVCLLLVVGLGGVVHVKWLELRLFYRSHFQHVKHNEDEKEFDVFLSYVWSPISAQIEGLDTFEEAYLSSADPLSIEEHKDTQRPLEVLLPQVLEDQWGYRLCLLERDMLPGGAYTNDVVLTIQRSRMLICLLSASYLCDSNAVFVLESGVQALLQNSALKLLLIWTRGATTSLIRPEPPLPPLVQRALKVLPSLHWTSETPSGGDACGFWRSLRKAMPHHREQS